MRLLRVFHRKPKTVSNTTPDDAAGDARTRDFSTRITTSCAHPLSASSWNRMKQGYQPKGMDDRWEISLAGEEKPVFARSWMRSPIVEIQVAAGDEARIVAIVWEGDSSAWTDGSEERAKELVRHLIFS
ncbi:hypothetical protein QIS74_03045 [Colletotrichum tabaci]|uniref:Uncharacterized protein n=1 Tax=Colletotrichum tabaci TaxID=1209068 RepID=A0AAV9TRM9_9PEZI